MEVKMNAIWMLIGLLLFAALTLAQHNNGTQAHRTRDKRMYVCPPDFVRVNQHCYYFSKDMQTWQQAYFECQDRFSDLAIIRNGKEDKSLKAFLGNQGVVPLERWIGGIYDWEQMLWKWASSGKKIKYQGFSRIDPYDKESLRWHCIIMDPTMQFKWSSRSCVHHKHYICQKRIRAVNNKERQKLKRKYKVNKDHRLNEVPIPTENRQNEIDRGLKPNNGAPRPALDDFDTNNELNAVAFARRNNETVAAAAGRGKGRGRKRNNRNREGGGRRNGGRNNRRGGGAGGGNTAGGENGPLQTRNGDQQQNWHRRDRDHYRKRRNKSKESIENLGALNTRLKPKTFYNEDVEINSLHPQVIVEDVDIPRI